MADEDNKHVHEWTDESASRRRWREMLIGTLVAILVLATLTPILHGCGDDLVIGGQLVVPTVNPTSNATPSETPDDSDEEF